MKYVYRGQRSSTSISGDNSTRIYKIIILVLLVLLIALSIYAFTGNKSFDDAKYKSTLISIANTEMKQAVTQAENLSRTASSGTATTLGKVRQYIHSLETLNTLNILSFGQSGRLYPQQLLDTTQGIIDAYATQLQTGQPTSEVLTKLMKNLSLLSEATQSLSIE